MENNNIHSRQKDLLVSETDKNLPPLRSDVEMIPVTHENRDLIYFHDPQGYMIKPFVLETQIAALLPLLNGNYSVEDIMTELKRYGSDVKEKQLLAFVRQLDKARLLLSPWFRHYKTEIEKEFEESDVRPAVCAGQSYPASANELEEFLTEAFSKNSESGYGKEIIGDKGTKKKDKEIRALFAPHIDPRVGLSSYVPAFKSLMEVEPRRVVLLATSHYSGMHYPLYDGRPFIATRKDFETPLGKISTDKQAMDILERHALETGCSFSDRAHRNEHSIELHLIFLQHIWEHSFQLIPLLVGSFEELYYKSDGDTGKKVNKMAALLAEQFDDDATLFLISGDLSHIGKKFGDADPASDMFDEVTPYDKRFLEHARRAEKEELLNLVSDDYDPYRICGFPPLYTAISALQNIKGEITSYEQWDESERESAVTFGSVLYRQ